MPSELNVNKISPASGTEVSLGDSGDTITIPSGVTLAGDGSNLTGVAPTKATIEALGIELPAANLTGTIHADRYTDTVYAHPTTAGNKHIPTAGATDQVLTYSSSGTAAWADPAAGGVTQSGFAAYITSSQTNVTGSGPNYTPTGAIWTEDADFGNDFSNGVFTAPVTGLYLLSCKPYFTGLTNDMTKITLDFMLSNGNVRMYHMNFSANFVTNTQLGLSYCHLAHMDASDTCYLRWHMDGSASNTADTGSGNTENSSQFSGVLIMEG